MKYTTKDGDMLDAICFDYYSNLNGTVEKVLSANQGLAQYALNLTAGLVIFLPEIIKQQKKIVATQIWD